jgi:hypothetical protein
MSNDAKPDNSPDVVTAVIPYTTAESPGGLPPEKAICVEESGTPLYIDDEELTIGELLDSISEEYLGDRQATLNELMRIADVGVELFYAAIAHRDVTPEVLEEARRRWGPLADVARLMDKPRRRGDQYGSRVTNHPVAQPVQLSPEILREMEDMDLLPEDGDPFWDEMWDEFVAHLGGVPQAVKACRKRQLKGQRGLRGYVVGAGLAYQRKGR